MAILATWPSFLRAPFPSISIFSSCNPTRSTPSCATSFRRVGVQQVQPGRAAADQLSAVYGHESQRPQCSRPVRADHRAGREAVCADAALRGVGAFARGAAMTLVATVPSSKRAATNASRSCPRPRRPRKHRSSLYAPRPLVLAGHSRLIRPPASSASLSETRRRSSRAAKAPSQPKVKWICWASRSARRCPS